MKAFFPNTLKTINSLKRYLSASLKGGAWYSFLKGFYLKNKA